MSIDLQDPIALTRNATQAVQRHAADAVDLLHNVDLPDPTDVVEHARKRANRAARRLEKRVDRASKRAAKQARAGSRHVRAAAGTSHRGRKVLVVLLVVGGGAAVAVVLANRMRRTEAESTAPDPFGTAVRAADGAAPVDGARHVRLTSTAVSVAARQPRAAASGRRAVAGRAAKAGVAYSSCTAPM